MSELLSCITSASQAAAPLTLSTLRPLGYEVETSPSSVCAAGPVPHSSQGTHKCLLRVCTVVTVATGQGPALLCHEMHVTLWVVTSSEKQFLLVENNDNKL